MDRPSYKSRLKSNINLNVIKPMQNKLLYNKSRGYARSDIEHGSTKEPIQTKANPQLTWCNQLHKAQRLHHDENLYTRGYDYLSIANIIYKYIMIVSNLLMRGFSRRQENMPMPSPSY